mmetsp:Transcript_75413/g.182202  ORF Transcript_75413/g.182202 Transcript_75413/m.182202 type:complete len:591 (-) Transcript_75413:193-1965(-)
MSGRTESQRHAPLASCDASKRAGEPIHGALRERAHLLAAEEGLLEDPGAGEDDCEVDVEEPGAEDDVQRASEDRRGDDLLVEELPQGAVHDEDGEGQAPERDQQLAREQLHDRVPHRGQHAGAVGRHEEEQEERHEDRGAREHVAQRQRPRRPEQDHPHHAHERQEHAGLAARGRLLLALRAVQHDQAAGDRPQQHLDERVEGAEALGVEDREVGDGLRHHGPLQEPPGAVVIAVAELGQEAQEEEDAGRAPQLPLGLLRQDAEGEGEHGHGEGQRREEPRRRVPHLRVHGEPGLGHGDRQESVGQRGGQAVEEQVGVGEDGREEQQDEQVQGVVAEDSLERPLGARGAQQLGARCPLAVLRGRVGRDVAAQREEGAHHHVDLRDGSEGKRRGRREGDKVPADDVADEEEANGIKGRDAHLLRLGRRRLRGRRELPGRRAHGLPLGRLPPAAGEDRAGGPALRRGHGRLLLGRLPPAPRSGAPRRGRLQRLGRAVGPGGRGGAALPAARAAVPAGGRGAHRPHLPRRVRGHAARLAAGSRVPRGAAPIPRRRGDYSARRLGGHSPAAPRRGCHHAALAADGRRDYGVAIW